MKVLRISYEGFGLVTSIYPATLDNEAYTELLSDLVGPYQFAMFINKISDETAAAILTEVYAKTIVHDHTDMDEEGWKEWFLSHPEEFHRTVYIAESPDLWEDMCDGQQRQYDDGAVQ